MRLTVVAGITSLVCGSCTFTVPSPPTLSFHHPKWDPSPSAKVMAASAPSHAARMQIYDEAKRCEHRLSELVSKMKSERHSRGALTIIGGTATLTGSFAAAVQNDGDNEAPKIVAASVAAVGGLVALASTLVGEPAVELDRYNIAVGHYENARAHATSFANGGFCDSDDCYVLIRSELARCSGDASAKKG